MCVLIAGIVLFPLISAWTRGDVVDVEEIIVREAPSNDTFQIWMVVFCCLFFCVAVRHINDFYAGETVTLVAEGTWGGRFKHQNEHLLMTAVEQDFAVMYEKLRKAERNAALNEQRYRTI